MSWSVGRRPKPPKKKGPPVAPTGPKALGLRRVPELGSGPFAVDFPIAFGSLPERMLYWAFWTLLGPERYGVWRYQDPVIAGLFELARVDFTLYVGGHKIAVRVQGEFPHYGSGAAKVAYDERQRLGLEHAGWLVVDVPSGRFENDPTGGAAIVAAKKAMRGEEEEDPRTAGTSFARPTRLVFGGS